MSVAEHKKRIAMVRASHPKVVYVHPFNRGFVLSYWFKSVQEGETRLAYSYGRMLSPDAAVVELTRLHDERVHTIEYRGCKLDARKMSVLTYMVGAIIWAECWYTCDELVVTAA